MEAGRGNGAARDRAVRGGNQSRVAAAAAAHHQTVGEAATPVAVRRKPGAERAAGTGKRSPAPRRRRRRCPLRARLLFPTASLARTVGGRDGARAYWLVFQIRLTRRGDWPAVGRDWSKNWERNKARAPPWSKPGCRENCEAREESCVQTARKISNDETAAMIWPGTLQQTDSKLYQLGGVLLGVKMSTYIFTASVCVCVCV